MKNEKEGTQFPLETVYLRLFAIGSGEMFRKRHGMSFTQRTQRSQRGAAPLGCPVPIFHSSFFIMPFPDGSIRPYSLILPLRPLRPLRENIIFKSTHCKQRGALFNHVEAVAESRSGCEATAPGQPKW
jgi:hypothetical protein